MTLVLLVTPLIEDIMCWIPFNQDSNENGVDYLLDLAFSFLICELYSSIQVISVVICIYYRFYVVTEVS